MTRSNRMNFRLKKTMIVGSGHRGINFLNDYDEADEEERR